MNGRSAFRLRGLPGLLLLAQFAAQLSTVPQLQARQELPNRVTSIQTARGLDRALVPSNGIPAGIEAVVTYLDSSWGMMMVADGPNGIFVTTEDHGFNPGDRVRILGRVIAGEFAPSIDARAPGSITRLGPGNLPAPLDLAQIQIPRGQEDARRVRIQATIGQVRNEPDQRVVLHLVSHLGEFTAYIPPRARTILSTNLVGARITAVGQCGTEFNALGQYINFNLFINSTNDIEFPRTPPTPLFELPLRPIRRIFAFEPDEEHLGFVRVQGTVTHVAQQFCVLQHGREAIRMRHPLNGRRPGIGQVLDVVGIPQPHDFGPILTASQYRVLSTGTTPPAEPLSAPGSLQYNHQNGLRVVCEGEIRLANTQSGSHILSLQRSATETLEVVIGSADGPPPPEALESDARLRVVGIFEPESVTPIGKTPPRIRVNSWADAVVLKISPSRRIHYIATGTTIAAFGVLGLAAVVVLRRLRGQDHALRTQKETQSDLQRRYDLLVERAVDLIYTLDQNGRVLSYNRAALQFFGIRPEEANQRSVLDVVVPEHRELARSRISQRFADPASATPFTVDVFDHAGARRTLEITSRVVLAPDGSPQVEGVARDITARRRMEEALRGLVATTATGSGEAFFQRVVRSIAETLCADTVLIAVPSKSRPDHFETLAVWRQGALRDPIFFPASGSPCAEVLAGRSLRLDRELQSRFPRCDHIRLLGANAFFGLSLQTTDGTALGVLSVLNDAPLQPSQYQIQFLEIIAARVGAEIDRLRADDHARNVAESLRKTNDLLLNLNRHHIRASADPSRMFEAIASHAVDGIQVARVSIWLLSPDRRSLVCAALVGPAGPIRNPALQIDVDQHPAYFAAIENERFISVYDGRTDPRTASFAKPYLIPLGITSMLDGPIRIEGRVVGSLCVEHVGEPRHWTDGETHLASALADMASIALQTHRRAGAERELDRRTRLLQNLAKLSRAMLTVDSSDSAIGAVVHGIGPATNADRCYYFARHRPPEDNLVSQRHEWCADGIPAELNNPALQSLDFAQLFPRWEDHFNRGEAICGPVRSFPRNEQDILDPQGILSILAVPVSVANCWIGFIGFDACREEREWERYEVDLLTTIAADLGRSLEQWETKRALREKEIHYESVVEVLAEGVMVADRSGRFTRSNANASRILGISAEQLQHTDLHSTAWSIIREDGSHLPNHEFPALRTLETGEPCTGVLMGIRRPDGDRCWISVNTRPLRDPVTGEVDSVVISFVDITESRRNRLELERARDAAEASNRAKADFLTVISHEVRTPLNAVLGYADILEQEIAEPDLRRYVRTIRQSGEGLLEIINDILDFSKLEAGRLKLEIEPFDLLETTFGVAELLAGRAASKGLSLAFNWHPDVPRHISGDPGRVRQIITNLLGNAVKFTTTGHVILAAQLLPQDATAPRRIRILVEDTGPGIPADKHSLLFQRFSRVDTSLTRRTGGTGLGLAIARQLAEAMDGRVGFNSNPGMGSVFWFDLPVPDTATPTPVTPATPPGTRIILLLQDSLATRILSTQCRHWGIEIVSIDSPSSLAVVAESASATRPFALVIAEAPLSPALNLTLRQLSLPTLLVEPIHHTPPRQDGTARDLPSIRRPLIHPDHLAAAIDAALSPESRRTQTPHLSIHISAGTPVHDR